MRTGAGLGSLLGRCIACLPADHVSPCFDYLDLADVVCVPLDRLTRRIDGGQGASKSGDQDHAVGAVSAQRGVER